MQIGGSGGGGGGGRDTTRYVQRNVTITELYLDKVRILTLSADSGIVRDNSRIAQGVFYRFLIRSMPCAK